jgi:hypothetical protein
MVTVRLNSPTGPKALRARLLEQEALELRLGGLSFGAIARKLNRQAETVRKAIRRAEARLREDIATKTSELVFQEHASLRLIESKLAEPVSRGEIRSIEILLAVKSLKYRLLGLGVVNTNNNHNHNGAVPVELLTRDQMKARTLALLAEHQRAKSTPPPGSPRPVAPAVRPVAPVDDPHDYEPAPTISALQKHDAPIEPYRVLKARHRATTLHERHGSMRG